MRVVPQGYAFVSYETKAFFTFWGGLGLQAGADAPAMKHQEVKP